MAVDARGFNLVTDVVGSFGRGFGAGQNIQNSLLRNQLLQQQVQQQQQQVNTANQMRELLMQFNTPQNEQQSLLAEQTANFNPVGQDQLSQQIRGEQPLSEAQLKAKARQIDPLVADKFFKAMGIDDATKREDFGRFAIGAMNQPEPIQNQMIQRRIEQIEANRGDATDTRDLLNIPIQNRAKALETIALSSLSVKDAIGAQQRGQQLAKGQEASAGQREFESLTKDLPAEQQKKAKLIKLGLAPRATGSAIQTISDRGIAEAVGKAEATISQRKKFGEMTGASRAKTIDQGFEKIQKINSGINTIDRAISALEGGAKTGAIQRFLPSINAASVNLDQIANQFALDVIGSVTLGAISEAELDLAKQTGLPTGLDEPELIKHLQDRRAAQEKLRNIYREQIDFLDQGGTIAGYLREKERKLEQTPPPPGFVLENP